MKNSTAKFTTFVAVSSSLAALPATALELGEVKVNSSLGQPLRASIAYALGPNEALYSSCVTLPSVVPKGDMPMTGPAAITVADGVISISGKHVQREPLVSMRVNVRCPYTPHLSRDYMLFIDPAVPTMRPTTVNTPVPQAASTPVSATRRTVSGEPIGMGTRYRVRRNEYLSQIVERIENRPVGHWPAIVAIFDANPDAFIDNDPNKLKPGSWLTIPDFGVDTPVTVAEATIYPDETQAVASSSVEEIVITPVPVVPRGQPISAGSIGIATRYRVLPGDSLGHIVERIENRPVGHWPAIHAIFDANPDAFIDHDINLLKHDIWINIPDFGIDLNIFASESTTPAATQESPATAYPRATDQPMDAPEPVAPEGPVDPVEPAAVLEPILVADTADDIIIDSDNAFAVTNDSADGVTIIIPDTVLDGPAVTSTSPNVPTATIQPAPAEPATSNWWMWLTAAGVALMMALAFLGRLLRGRFGSSPIAPVAAAPRRRRSDAGSATTEPESIIEVEEIIQDESPTEENLVLDADLIVGTGLQESSDIAVAQDFGFAATTALDLELPEEMSSGAYEKPPTEIIPPLNVGVGMDSILESEVLPEESGDDVDDYDMSVVVDATKMPRPEDVTEHDLEAIAVETSDETLITDDYTVNQDDDYKILEQDYEDEFTATQVLNQEIARAAAEIAARMGDESGEKASDISLASVTALDVTSRLSAQNDDGVDDTDINEVLTVNMAEADITAEMQVDGDTAETQVCDLDRTAEVQAKKGKTG